MEISSKIIFCRSIVEHLAEKKNITSQKTFLNKRGADNVYDIAHKVIEEANEADIQGLIEFCNSINERLDSATANNKTKLLFNDIVDSNELLHGSAWIEFIMKLIEKYANMGVEDITWGQFRFMSSTEEEPVHIDANEIIIVADPPASNDPDTSVTTEHADPGNENNRSGYITTSSSETNNNSTSVAIAQNPNGINRVQDSASYAATVGGDIAGSVAVIAAILGTPIGPVIFGGAALFVAITMAIFNILEKLDEASRKSIQNPKAKPNPYDFLPRVIEDNMIHPIMRNYPVIMIKGNSGTVSIAQVQL